MSAVQAEPPSTDGLVVRLDEVLADLAEAVADHSPASDADRIDRIARLEKLRAVTAALQAAESVRFADSGLHSGPHKIIITTPTGHHYLSRAPDPP
jgi:hypothetical protein